MTIGVNLKDFLCLYSTPIIFAHCLLFSIRPTSLQILYFDRTSPSLSKAFSMEKTTASHLDAIEQVSHDSNSDTNMSGDQAIIHELETHGEEIGMTWRTVLAAAVS
jgi:hypothetical protein